MTAWLRLIIAAIPWIGYLALAVLYRPLAKEAVHAVSTGAECFHLMLINDSLEYETKLLPGSTGRKAR